MFKTFLLIAAFLGPNDEFDFKTIAELSGATACNSKAEELNDLVSPHTEQYEFFCQVKSTPYFSI